MMGLLAPPGNGQLVGAMETRPLLPHHPSSDGPHLLYIV